MPQVQLPIFPAGVTHINSEVAFEERDGKVYYFNGHLPVFVHEKSALATFRLFSTQLVINGNATQAEISRAFGVPLVTVKRYVKLYRQGGAAAFFAPARRRSASKLTEQVCLEAQGLLDQGLEVPEVGRQLGILPNTMHKAIRAGRLRPGKKRAIPGYTSQHQEPAGSSRRSSTVGSRHDAQPGPDGRQRGDAPWGAHRV
jgi:transposase-like protein